MTKKRGCFLLLAVLSIMIIGVVVILGVVLLSRPATQPVVLIRSPQNGERVGVGQETVIQATARGEQNIRRVELWVDGRLQDAQSSNLPGGSSPFPITTNWRPPTPGAHSVVVRAFNVQGTQGQAAINVEAVQSGDGDHDNVPDALDGCPDQPGLTTNNGCPLPAPGDRDGDGVRDGSDACPDQPGTLLARGCPDGDGDGIGDSTDACPRESGTAEHNGCPAPGDSDSDGVPDASDACPRESGRAETGGCPDRDADGIRDSEDACPDVAGPSATRGCPDGDGDGVYDAIDLCPTVPGPATNSGCPPTGSGDSDGDGVDNSTDLRGTEPGPAEGGGAPPPGGGTDGDGDGSVDVEEPPPDPGGDAFGGFQGLFLQAYQFTTVEVQALEFQASHDLNEVYCYASLANLAEERIGPFASLGGRRWDIAAMMGPLNSRTVGAAVGLPLQVRVECSGIVAGSSEGPEPGAGFGDAGGDEAYFDLGSISQSHVIASTMVVEETVDSGGGSAGHSFRVKYRVCVPGCTPAAIPAPSIRLTHPSNMHFLWWDWSGQRYDINGFKVYMNGNYMFPLEARDTFHRFTSVPPCGQSYNIQLTAYRGNPSHPDAESPRSNTQTWDGGLCARTVTVSFGELIPFYLSRNDDLGDVGPLFGYLQVGDDRRDFEADYRLDTRRGAFEVSEFYPRTDFTVELGPEDSLYIAASIRDRDPGLNPNDTVFSGSRTLSAEEITAGRNSLGPWYPLPELGSPGDPWGAAYLEFHITVTPRP